MPRRFKQPGDSKKLSRWRVPDTRITIERVEEGPQKHEYLFSTGTVNRSVTTIEKFHTGPIARTAQRLSQILPMVRFCTGTPTVGSDCRTTSRTDAVRNNAGTHKLEVARGHCLVPRLGRADV